MKQDQLIGSTIADRYRLIAALGRGGMGLVYRAQDMVLNREVALKILRDNNLGTEGRARLLNEAQAVAQLNHPNIVSVYDAGEEVLEGGGQPRSYVVMELVEGAPLRVKERLDVEEVVDIAGQICSALAHAHSRGIIHRDLKPENVILRDDGRVKVVDFGLARSVASRMTQEGAIVGTVFYMAPELALGEEFDGRADLYALGIMLYELTTGRLPFTADDPVAVISQHLYAPVVPPRTRNEAIPPTLNDLIVRLMSKEPADRPASAGDLEKLFVETDFVHDAVQERADQSATLLDRIVRGRFVGRRREFEECRRIWLRSQAGDSQVLLISGEPGVGKSRLILELATQVEVSGCQVLIGECYREGGMPYEPFVQLVGSVLSREEDPSASPPEFVLADLISLVPTLQSQFPDLPSNPPLEARAEQFRLFESLVALFEMLAELSPLLLVVEDLQWADEDTLNMLRHLVRRIGDCPVLVVGTYRKGDLDPASAQASLLEEFYRLRYSHELELAPFDKEGSAKLLASIFAEDINRDFLQSVYERTEGNPFFIEEVCKALIDTGAISFSEGAWQRPRIESLEIPSSIRITVRRRVAKLSKRTQDVLQKAAILGREFALDVLAAVDGGPRRELIRALEEAQKAQLIVTVRGEGAGGSGGVRESRRGISRFRFSHALIQATLEADLQGILQSELHLRVAQGLEQLRSDEYHTIASHYSQAGDHKQARRYYVRAANRSRQVYAYQEAVRYYSLALQDLPEENPDRFEILQARAQTFDNLAARDAQLADARELVKLAETGDDPARLCDALLALSDVYLKTGHALAKEPAEQAVSLAREHGDLVREGRALRRLGDQAHRRYDLNASRVALETASARFRRANYLGEAASCLSILSVVLGKLGEDRAAREAAEEAVRYSQKAGEKSQEATSRRRLAIYFLDQSQFHDALPFAQTALRMHQEIGDQYEICNDLNAIGILQTKLGRREMADENFWGSLEAAEKLGSVTAILYAINNLLLFHFQLRGDYEGGLNFLDDQLKRSKDAGDSFSTGVLLSHKANLLARIGQNSLALVCLKEMLPLAESLMGLRAKIDTTALMGLLEAESGNPESAHRHLEEALQLALGSDLELDQVRPRICLAKAALVPGFPAGTQEGLEMIEPSLEMLQEAGGSWVDSLGEAFCTAAQLYLQLSRGDDVPANKAQSYLEQVMDLAQSSPEVAPPEIYHYLYSVALRKRKRTERAAHHLDESYRQVMAVADQISNPAFRESWMTGVRINREICDQIQKFGGGGQNPG